MKDPIIVVGCGRSGTTLLYEMLCCHEDLAWFSNLTDKFPSLPVLAAWANAFPAATRLGLNNRLVPIPSEGYQFWNSLCAIDGLSFDNPLTENDVTPRARTLVQTRIASLLRFQRRPRFVNKNTRNTRRLRYVQELLGQPLFINVVREPRATVASLLRVAFWPSMTVWSEENVSTRDWQQQGRDPAELAALLWASDVGRSLEDKEMIPADRYLEIRYESLVEDSRNTLEKVLSLTGLEATPRFQKSLESFRIVDANKKYSAQLSQDQLDIVLSITGPLAERLGYRL